jgi:hypothetical protein
MEGIRSADSAHPARQVGRARRRHRHRDREASPRQLGTYASQRAAQAAARSTAARDRTISRDTVGWLVRRYVASQPT